MIFHYSQSIFFHSPAVEVIWPECEACVVIARPRAGEVSVVAVDYNSISLHNGALLNNYIINIKVRRLYQMCAEKFYPNFTQRFALVTTSNVTISQMLTMFYEESYYTMHCQIIV